MLGQLLMFNIHVLFFLWHSSRRVLSYYHACCMKEQAAFLLLILCSVSYAQLSSQRDRLPLWIPLSVGVLQVHLIVFLFFFSPMFFSLGQIWALRCLLRVKGCEMWPVCRTWPVCRAWSAVWRQMVRNILYNMHICICSTTVTWMKFHFWGSVV